MCMRFIRASAYHQSLKEMNDSYTKAEHDRYRRVALYCWNRNHGAV